MHGRGSPALPGTRFFQFFPTSSFVPVPPSSPAPVVDSIAAESLDLLLVTGPLSVFVRSSALMKTIDSFGEGEVGGNSAVQFLTRSGLTREQLREVRRHRDSVPVPLLLSM